MGWRWRKTSKRGGSDRTKRVWILEKSGHIMCYGNVFFETIGRSHIYLGERRARRRIKGNSSGGKPELGQSLYPDGVDLSVWPDQPHGNASAKQGAAYIEVVGKGPHHTCVDTKDVSLIHPWLIEFLVIKKSA